MLERKKNVWDEAKDNETFERCMAAMSDDRSEVRIVHKKHGEVRANKCKGTLKMKGRSMRGTDQEVTGYKWRRCCARENGGKQ